MPWKGQPEFNSKRLKTWHSDGEAVGEYKEVLIKMENTRSTQKTAGLGNIENKGTRFAFLTVAGAGHMVSTQPSCNALCLARSKLSQVPLDQPKTALDMVVRWIQGGKFD
jgi:hypothetical protein